MIEAIKKGFDPVPMIGPMKELEAERIKLEAELVEIEADKTVITLHPGAVRAYRTNVERLAELLADNNAGDCDDLIATIRRLVVAVTIHPEVEGFTFDVTGRLTEIARSAGMPFAKCPVSGGQMVAGEGLEPPTSGL